MTEEYSIPLEKLKDIVSQIMQAAEGSTLEQVLQRIAHVARELIGAKYAALGVPDGHGSLRFFKFSGLSEEAAAVIEHPPVGSGLLGVIMNDRQTLRLPRMQDDPRSSGFPEGHPPMTSLLGVPIVVGQDLFGMFYLTDRIDGQPFSLTDEWLLETLAGYAALAIAGTHLREQGQRIALLEERQRIGMELHDGVIQSLYAVGMQLDLMRNAQHVETETLTTIIEGLNEVIEDIRGYILDLKTLNRSTMTLRKRLEDVVSHLYVPADVNVTIDAPDGPAPFPPEKLESICFIAQEAISNALRHADASLVTVRCRVKNGAFRLSVIDDGRGFDPGSVTSQSGLGLHNIRERVKQNRGELNITSKTEQGTTLTINIPVP